jgi:COP9 signalosome complex subunit 7
LLMSSSISASLDALDGFVVLAKQSTGSQCVMIIKQVLKHPSIYVFGELLAQPHINELANSQEHKLWLELLQLFAYGTYTDYRNRQSSPNKLPELSSVELNKLKQLTLVDLAAKKKVLFYKDLLQILDLSSVRELEDLIIECFYNNLLQGKLDQQAALINISNTIGRDIGPNDVDSMLQILDHWVNTSQTILNTLENKVQQANSTVQHKKQAQTNLEAEKKNILEAIKIQKEQGGTDPAIAAAIMNAGGSRGGEGSSGVGPKRKGVRDFLGTGRK